MTKEPRAPESAKYLVRWDDHEGNRHEMAFDNLEDARLEAEALKTKFDYVKISIT